MDFQIGVIIATAFQRTDLLFERSLKSVLNQTYKPDFIIIVDDNQNENEFNIIAKKISQLNNSNIFVIHNSKTKYHSGTGSWNSGVDFLCSKFNNSDKSFIAILDDDDEWNNVYLEKCVEQINLRGIENTKAVFANLIRLHNDFNIQFDISVDNLTCENFLIGNPGVQGSNMFFCLQSFLDLSGFDETLKSCTDRDLMIRFLRQNSTDKIGFIKETLVYHYARNENTVTNNSKIKWAGLDGFYKKYLHLFNVDILEKSLQRAEEYFMYPNRQQIYNLFLKQQKIVLSMPLHNGAATIRNAVLSCINQKNIRRKLLLVIGNDNSNDHWQEKIKDLLSENIIFVNIDIGEKVYKTRNAINEYILKNIEHVDYIGRLDADDELADDFVISKLEELIDAHNPDIIFSGNYQQQNHKIVGTNIPSKNLLSSSYLHDQLYKMSLGDFSAELPSCNTFVKPECMIRYPEKESAEDHWFTVDLLLKSDTHKIYIADDLIYSIYSLSGNVTTAHKDNNSYIDSRKDLYEYFKKKIDRRKKALEILQSFRSSDKNYICLGEGQEAVVYHDEKNVYKIYDSMSDSKFFLFEEPIM
ncbi:MAG: glycosyltransferase [Rickettsiales bacterium]|jgi:glycosyltransferase involved in cell wall biosynthesis|nr:glycosyltransferase [Rickettsiales bacterium]